MGGGLRRDLSQHGRASGYALTGFAIALTVLPIVIGLYAYIGYPIVLWLIARWRRPGSSQPRRAFPQVTVVIPAYNEERQLRGAIEAVLAQDYPHDRLQILILSDASTDATDTIASEYSSRGVELLRAAQRSGKTKMENDACAHIRGDIVVNTDSSIRLHPAAVSKLVDRMWDPSVGVASGRDVSISAAQSGGNSTEAGYVSYEMKVRSLETRGGGIVGASGSCYAIRTDLHRIPIRDDLSRDFSAALTARRHGFRAISVDDAICYVPRTSSLRREYRRKVRTISRGMETLLNQRELLIPARHGIFAWKLFSHKICRWLVPVSTVPAVVGLLLLSGAHVWARGALAAGAITIAIAIAGTLWPPERPMPKLISLVSFTVAANVAVLVATWKVIFGHEDHIWEPTRRSG